MQIAISGFSGEKFAAQFRKLQAVSRHRTMPLLIFIILIVAFALWWSKGKSALSQNERQYLKRRGYETDAGLDLGPPVAEDARLQMALDSLSDLSPYSRQRAAQDLARLCEEGQADALMFYPLIDALNDSDASVRSAVVAALAKLGDVRAVDFLRQRLEMEESLQTISALRKALQGLEAKRSR
ncbi:MAG: HEAT repeat domain-containing protein [Acidobacteria bacterium]|nr:HEAT repeat domain-containing protein [Acidobacteriota bacterium]